MKRNEVFEKSILDAVLEMAANRIEPHKFIMLETLFDEILERGKK